MPAWRTFEVSTRVEILNPSGATHAWLPLPLSADTDYYRGSENRWTGNVGTARTIRVDDYGTGLLHAEWPASENSPALELTSRFATRNRSVDLWKPPSGPVRENESVLKHFLEPTKFIPTDGIVAETSRKITAGHKNDMDKARAIYEWMVENTFRDPKVRGCGLGDIRVLLETGYLGGKCADLNALYVGLARAAGLPARDLYGVRCGPSAEFRCLGKDGDITKAQHCRAEVYVADYGWVPVDPADVRKVVLEEKPSGLTLEDEIVKRARNKLFGAWEMNYLPFNYAHDVRLQDSTGAPVPFLMYPQAETADGRRDSLDPAAFKYNMTARELSG
jgi:transglutaminase-like putative cysteine protease